MRRVVVVVVVLAAVAGCGGGRDAGPPRPQRLAAPAGPAASPPLTRRPAGRSIHVGALPDAVAADPRAHTFAVAIHDPSRLALVDSRSGRIRERVDVPVGQQRIVPPAVFLVPAETGRRAVAVVPATRTPPSTLPQSAAVVLGRTFVTNGGAGAVDVLDRGRPTARLGPATRPAGIASADFDRALAVVSSQRRTLELYDPRTLRRIASTPAGRGPTNVVALGDLIFVADTRGDAILTFSTRPRLHAVGRRAIPGSAPYGLAIDPVRRRLHITLTATNQLLTVPIDGTITGTTIRATVRQPDAVAVDSTTGTIAIAGRTGGLLQLITAELSGAPLPRHARPPG